MMKSFQSYHSDTYRDCQADARGYTVDALRSYLEIFAVDMADPNPDWPGPVGRHLAAERHRAVTDELDRRVRISKLPAPQASKLAQDHAQWIRLASAVRARVTVREVLELSGLHLVVSDSGEAHSPCPVCGGRDRLVIWPTRCWCRQCRWSADVIAVTQSFLPGCAHFRDAVTALARIAFVAEAT